MRLMNLAALALCAGAATFLPAQERGVDLATRSLNVFLDCSGGCDGDYIRTETPWVEFVRDRFVADVHLIITNLNNGSGGRAYQLEVIGFVPGMMRSDTLRLSTEPNATSDDIRAALLRSIHLGLVPYASRSAVASLLTVRSSTPRAESGAPAQDRWNLWVFTVGADGSFDKEARREEEEFEGSFRARRIDANWKFGFEVESEINRRSIELSDRTAVNTVSEFQTGAVLIRSIGPRMGIGLEATTGSATFDNLDRVSRVAPAVEVSLWPYSEAQRRQLIAQLSVGVSSFDYGERTLFDRLEETRPTSALILGYDARQPWGSASMTLEGSAFLHDTQRHRIVFDYDASIRVTTGLSIDLGGSASLVRDQLNIAARDATPEEILLELRELGTDYRYDFRVGLSYTFGSIFNSVVNPRFGSGPGSILR
jgi:hypothetical protein